MKNALIRRSLMLVSFNHRSEAGDERRPDRPQGGKNEIKTV